MERKRKKLMYCILPIAIVLLFLVATFSLGGFNVNTQAAFADDKFFGVIEITSDMLPENDNKITASQFSGFESVEEINAGRWVPIEKTGNSFLIYGFDANTVQIKLATGEFVGTSLNESKTNNDLRAMLNEGYKGYYTTSKDNAQSQNGTTEDVIFVRTQFADSSCFPNEFSYVQSTQLTGFSPITYEQAKQWNPKIEGNIWLIYDFDGTNPARVLFENGVYKSVDFGTITNDAIYSQIESKLYGWCYTTGVGKYVKITPDMLPESGYVSVDQFEGFMKMRYDEFRFSQIPDKTRDCYFIYKGDENKITCYVYKNGRMDSEGYDITYLSNPGLKSRIEEGECWYYIAEVSEEEENGDLNQHDHSDGWTEWNNATSLPINEGKYYLTVDVTLGDSWEIPNRVTLCLNGHGIKASGSGYALIYLSAWELNICDCGTTTHYFDVDETGLAVNVDENEGENRKSFVGGYLFGAKVSPKDWFGGGAAIYAHGNGTTVNMYGGTLIGNYVEGEIDEYDMVSGGGTVFIGADCAFNMYGGSICYNVGARIGGISLSGDFAMYGGSIDHNKGEYCGAIDLAYLSNNPVVIAGGRIVENVAIQSGCGGAFYNNTSRLVFSGNPVVTGNTAGGEASDIWLYVGDKITIGGPLDESARIGIKCVSMNGGVVTSGLEQNGTVNNFVCNRTELLIKINDDGEIEFYKQYYHVETSFELGKFNGKITVTLTNTADESEYKAEDVDPDNVIFSNIPKGDYILTVSWVDGVRNSISMPLKVEPKTQPANASKAQKVENGDYCDNYGPIVKNADEVAKKEETTSGAKNKSTDAKEEKEEESENNAKNRSNDNSENNADRNIIVMTPFFGSPIILKKEERQLVEAISNGETSFNANNASDGIEINAPRNACYGGEAFVSEEEQKLLKVALANGKTALGDKDDKKLKDEENEEE